MVVRFHFLILVTPISVTSCYDGDDDDDDDDDVFSQLEKIQFEIINRYLLLNYTFFFNLSNGSSCRNRGSNDSSIMMYGRWSHRSYHS